MTGWERVPIMAAGNGLPVPTRARPSVHARTSDGMHSARGVGFDSGSTIGRMRAVGLRSNDLFGEQSGLAGHADQRVRRDMTNDLEQRDLAIAVGQIARPIPMDGRTPPGSRADHRADRAADRRDRRASTPTCLVCRNPGRHERARRLSGDADTGRTGADDDHPQVDEWSGADAHAADDCCDGDGGGALDVVVERADAVAMRVEQPVGVALGEVLPLQQHARATIVQRRHERADQLVVLLVAQATMTPTEVQRIRQQRLVLGADVEEHRQRAFGSTPPTAVYSASLPIGMPIPPTPRSPSRGCARHR